MDGIRLHICFIEQVQRRAGRAGTLGRGLNQAFDRKILPRGARGRAARKRMALTRPALTRRTIG
jgi:hypothetical protein